MLNDIPQCTALVEDEATRCTTLSAYVVKTSCGHGQDCVCTAHAARFRKRDAAGWIWYCRTCDQKIAISISGINTVPAETW